MISLIGMVVVVSSNYRSVKDEDLRRRVRWVVYAALLATAPLIWWAIVTSIEMFLGAARVSWDPLDPRPDGSPIPPAPMGAIEFTRANSGEDAETSPTPGPVPPAYVDD